jgi:hypothetical protein
LHPLPICSRVVVGGGGGRGRAPPRAGRQTGRNRLYGASIQLTQGIGYCELAVNFSYIPHYISLAS